jgi:hypothetical protein
MVSNGKFLAKMQDLFARMLIKVNYKCQLYSRDIIFAGQMPECVSLWMLITCQFSDESEIQIGAWSP